MFSSEFGMHQAAVAGTKTRTRRIYTESARSYRVGEVLYVKEPYFLEQRFDLLRPKQVFCYDDTALPRIHYANDGLYLGSDVCFGKERNKMFMPENLARYHIEITAKQFCYLQNITDEECIKEGIGVLIERPKLGDKAPFKLGEERAMYKNYERGHEHQFFKEPQLSYKSLWERINGKGSWEQNPMVWDYEFKLITD